MNTQTIELDVSKGGFGRCVRVGQGDHEGTTIRALLYDNGAELGLDGAATYLVARLPDRKHYYRAPCTVSGNVATCVLDESRLCAVPGHTDEAYITVTKDGATASTERFGLDILRSALDGQVPAESWDAAVDDVIERGNAAVDRASAAAGTADAAAGRANAAADAADKATSAASSAAGAADASREAADSAASSAASAASSATAAAGRATESAAAADSAASSASAAAEAANASKAGADTAAAAANEAADSASSAATSASAATDSANGAAKDALAAAEEARGSVSADRKIYLTFDSVGGTDYISLVDTEE